MLDGMCNDGRCLHYVLPAPLIYVHTRFDAIQVSNAHTTSPRAPIGPPSVRAPRPGMIKRIVRTAIRPPRVLCVQSFADNPLHKINRIQVLE